MGVSSVWKAQRDSPDCSFLLDCPSHRVFLVERARKCFLKQKIYHEFILIFPNHIRNAMLLPIFVDVIRVSLLSYTENVPPFDINIMTYLF